MKAKALAQKAALTTVGALAVAWYAIGSVDVSGLVSSDWTVADVVRRRCPLHLIRPEWITGKDWGSTLSSWAATETRARLALVCVLWAGATGLLVWRALRRPAYDQTA